MFENIKLSTGLSFMPTSLKKLFLFSFSFLSISYSDGQITAPNFDSYEVSRDNMVTFRFLAPNAKEVKLNSQLAQGSQLMTKGDNGIWSVKLGPVKPDMYPYHFVVDGVTVADPRNTAIFPNEGFQSSIVEITGSSPLIHTIRNVPHGTLSYRYYHSAALGTRPVVIYTPPGFFVR